MRQLWEPQWLINLAPPIPHSHQHWHVDPFCCSPLPPGTTGELDVKKEPKNMTIWPTLRGGAPSQEHPILRLLTGKLQELQAKLLVWLACLPLNIMVIKYYSERIFFNWKPLHSRNLTTFTPQKNNIDMKNWPIFQAVDTIHFPKANPSFWGPPSAPNRFLSLPSSVWPSTSAKMMVGSR